MTLLQTNVFHPLSVAEHEFLQLIDVFDNDGKKTIELHPYSSLTYLIVGWAIDIDISVITTWTDCTCTIFWLFVSDAKRPVTGSLKVSLNHSHTSADIELISFLYDGAKIAIDGSIDIWTHLDQVHGHLLEHNIVLGKQISLKTLPKLAVASYNVTAAHGAKIDTIDQQKLFYMMSRGLSQAQSQTLLVHGYIDAVLAHFGEISDKEKEHVRKILVQ